jgi:hypothetical protein
MVADGELGAGLVFMEGVRLSTCSFESSDGVEEKDILYSIILLNNIRIF